MGAHETGTLPITFGGGAYFNTPTFAQSTAVELSPRKKTRAERALRR
jgi:hypothetical protein